MADDILKDALEAFEAAQDAESENRQNFKDDILFARMGEQWDAKMADERKRSGRPCLTINKLLPVIRQVVNDARQNRPSIACHPVDSGGDKETADVLSGMIRNIEASSDADVAYDTAVDNAVSGGFGYWRINTDYALNALSDDQLRGAGASAFEQDLFIRRIANPLSVYGDPYDTGADSANWMQAHVVDTIRCDQFKKKYPGAQESDFKGDTWSRLGAPWIDGEEVQIAEFWQRQEVVRKAVLVQYPDTEEGPGEVMVLFEDDPALKRAVELGGQVVGQPRPVKSFKVKQHIVSGAEVLETKDWAGAYIPIVPVYGDEVIVEGKRHFRSLIRDAKDTQRMFNYWRTVTTEAIALAPRVPFIMEDNALPENKGEARKWSTANSASHPYLLHRKGTNRPSREPFAGVPTGMIQEAMSAADDIKAITGIYDASLGARSNETSGRAIMARQREGDVSTFHFIDNLTRAIRHSGRILIDLIPKVYPDERIVRILGEDGKRESVKVNGPTQGPDGTERIHDLRTGRYDVTVTAGPSFTSRREEAAQQMIELIRSYPDAAPIIGDLLARNLDWPGADEIAKRLEKLLPPEARDEQGGIDPAVQQQIEQMAQALQEMGQRLQEAESKRDMDELKLKIEGYKAETERMTALAPAFGPDQIAAVVQQTLAEIAGNVLPEAEGAPSGPGSFEQPMMGQAA